MLCACLYAHNASHLISSFTLICLQGLHLQSDSTFIICLVLPDLCAGRRMQRGSRAGQWHCAKCLHTLSLYSGHSQRAKQPEAGMDDTSRLLGAWHKASSAWGL